MDDPSAGQAVRNIAPFCILLRKVQFFECKGPVILVICLQSKVQCLTFLEFLKLVLLECFPHCEGQSFAFSKSRNNKRTTLFTSFENTGRAAWTFDVHAIENTSICAPNLLSFIVQNRIHIQRFWRLQCKTWQLFKSTSVSAAANLTGCNYRITNNEGNAFVFGAIT